VILCFEKNTRRFKIAAFEEKKKQHVQVTHACFENNKKLHGQATQVWINPVLQKEAQ
jgi:hypothetical protein